MEVCSLITCGGVSTADEQLGQVRDPDGDRGSGYAIMQLQYC